jgi:hypothetical protein
VVQRTGLPTAKTSTAYEICNPAGDVVAIHVRTDKADGSKGFTWRRPGGLSGLGGLRVVSLPLFGVELLGGEEGPVYLCEGEKAALALRHLGALAVGTVTGAAAIPSAEPLAVLNDRDVILWPDHDDVGRDHMRRISESLQGIAKSIRIISWGTDNGDDAADFVERSGTRGDLERLLADSKEPNEPKAQALETAGRLSVCLRDVKAEHLSWLWAGRLLFRKVNLLDGDPDLGKTTITLDIAARVTRGLPMPLESEGREPGNVLYVQVEDGLGDTVKPRFEAAGGDSSRFHAIDLATQAISLPDDCGRIAEEALRVGAKLIIFETLSAVLGEKINSFKDADIRRAMTPLRGLAERTGACVLAVRHLNKKEGGNPLYRGGGSIAMIAAARSGLIVARDPDDEAKRVLAVSKKNLADAPPAISYRIERARTEEGISTSRIAWLGKCDHSPAQLLAPANEPGESSAIMEAVTFLEEMLASGRVSVKDLTREAHAAGITDSTLKRARQRLKIQPRKDGFGGGWYLELPASAAEGDQGDPKRTTPDRLVPFEEIDPLRERDGPGA